MDVLQLNTLLQLSILNTRQENHVSPNRHYSYLELMKKVDDNLNFGFWMGARDIDREGFYVWLDGSEGKFTL